MAQKKANETMSKSLLDLAGALVARDSGEDQWSPLEHKVCVAMCSAAMRKLDMDGLAEALAAFGGYPNPGSDIDKECVDLLHQSAKRPGAFGFGYLLGKAWEQKQARSVKNLDDVEAHQKGEQLGAWLRRGLFNSAWDDQRDAREALGASSHRCMPVAACLVGDNPVALAEILSVPAMLDALVSMEPKKLGAQVGKDIAKDDWQYAKKMAEAVRSAEAGIETSLIFQAVSCKAFKCAALLARVPEFSAHAFTPGALGCALHKTIESRRAQTVFKEDLVAEAVEYCLFEKIVSMEDDLDNAAYASRDRLKADWAKLIDSAIQGAPEAAKTMHQKGTGMGWALMHAARAKPWRWGGRMESNEFAARDIQRAMSVWDAMEREGFAVPWETLAEISSGCDPLRQWLELKSASTPEGKLVSKRSPSI